MKLKKSGGKVFGADLTSAEKKAMEMEIRRQLVDYNRQNMNEIDALILWHLHIEYGFGKKRLLRFYESFNKRVEEMMNYYMMDSSKAPWMYTEKLKEYGIDIKELNKRKG